MKLHCLSGLLFVSGSLVWLAGPAGAVPVAAKPAPASPAKAAGPAAAAVATEPAEIVVPKEALGGSSALEVRFPSPMIAPGQVGLEVEIASVLEIKPALAGTFRWQSTRSGILQTEGVLPLDTTWRIA